MISNRTVNEARFGYVSRSRGLLANNAGVPQHHLRRWDDRSSATCHEPGRVHAEDVSLGRHGVDVARQSHVKFGGEVRHIRDDSDFAVRRPVYRVRSTCSTSRWTKCARDDHRHQPRTGLIEPNIRNFRFWETGVFLQDDWKIRSEPDDQPRAPARVVRAADGGERPADQHHSRSREPTSSSRSAPPPWAGRPGRAERLQQLRAAPRLLVGSRCQQRHAWPIRGGYGIAYERLFNNSITNIRFNPPDYSFTGRQPGERRLARRHPDRLRPDQSRRHARATSRSRSPGRTTTSACSTASGSKATSSAGIPRFGTSHQSLRVPDPNTKDAYTHNWFVGAQTEIVWNSCSRRTTSATSAATYGRLVDYNTVRGDLFDGRLDRLNPSFGGINYRAMLARTRVPRPAAPGEQAPAARILRSGVVHARQGDGHGLRRPGGRHCPSTRATSISNGGRRTSTCGTVSWSTGCGSCPFLRDAPGLAGALLGGWQINGITALQSGFPFNVFTNRAYAAGGDYNGDGVNNDRPNLPAFGLELPDTSKEAYLNGLFVAADFPRPDVLGTLPRNAYRGPGFASTDLSLFKDFRLPMPARSSSSGARRSTCSTASTCSARRQHGAGHLRTLDASFARARDPARPQADSSEALGSGRFVDGARRGGRRRERLQLRARSAVDRPDHGRHASPRSRHRRPWRPHWTRSRAESVVFETAISVGPLTLPSHASLFTASSRLRTACATTISPRSPRRTPTYAAWLASRGYRHGGVRQRHRTRAALRPRRRIRCL